MLCWRCEAGMILDVCAVLMVVLEVPCKHAVSALTEVRQCCRVVLSTTMLYTHRFCRDIDARYLEPCGFQNVSWEAHPVQ